MWALSVVVCLVLAAHTVRGHPRCAMTSDEVDQATKESARLITYEPSSSHGDVCRDPLDENSFFCPSGCIRVKSVPYCKAAGPSLHPCRVGKKEQPVGTWKKNAGQETAAVLRRPFNHAGAAKRAGGSMLRSSTEEDASSGAPKLDPGSSSPIDEEVKAHASADVDVFIRCTKAEAYRLLPYALEAVRRFGIMVGLIRSCVVCFPASDHAAFTKVKDSFAKGNWLVLAPTDSASKGLPAFFDHLRADTLGATAPFVMHMEARMLLMDNVRRADLISTHHGHDHKPFLVRAPFSSLPSGVEASVRGSMEMAGIPPETVRHSTLLGRFVIPRAAYGLLRRRLVSLHASAGQTSKEGVKDGGGHDAALEAAVRAAYAPLDNPLKTLHASSVFGALLLYVQPDGRLRPSSSPTSQLSLVHAVPIGALMPAFFEFASDFDPTRDALRGCYARCVLESPSTAESRCGPASSLSRHKPPPVKCAASLGLASGKQASERATLGFQLLHEEKAERMLALALEKEQRDAQDEKDARAREEKWG